MNSHAWKTSAAWAVATCGTVALLLASAYARHPGVLSFAPWPQIGFAVLGLVLAVLALRLVIHSRGSARIGAAGVCGVLLFVTAGILLRTFRAESLRDRVLAAPAPELREAARHVIAGFTTMAEARALARAGVAGLFLSPRNVRDETIGAIAADVASLQALRRELNLPPLWIAADQEGGLVANLSPPLPRPPALADIAADRDGVIAAGDALAADLRSLGVDVDFAPVVDVSRGRVDPADRHTKIALRAISSDPAEIAAVARLVCERLAAAGVRCTLKHFPGIGAVTADTHIASAHLPTIAASDLAPFEALTRPPSVHPWVMLGHVTIDDLDSAHPASASAPVIAVLRRSGFDGIVVTDDASMAAYRSALAENAVATLKGGADLVLASYDPDVAFEVVAALLERARADADLRAAMAASDRRLAGEGQ